MKNIRTIRNVRSNKNIAKKRKKKVGREWKNVEKLYTRGIKKRHFQKNFL